MIVFDLKCICGFQFEGWFESRADFERQRESNLLHCPKCGSDAIKKILSPVAVHSGAGSIDATSPSTLIPTEAEFAEGMLRTLQEYVEKNFEDVGAKLAEESLKIHYGVKDKRNIRGVTTPDEEKMLKDEGIELLKVPMPVKKDVDSN
ncbi:MAG: DUF1178 family protein [Desulfobulbaceae bacterium]|nr:DUF1178 family protein [Desulfobulbaceae bacterium]